MQQEHKREVDILNEKKKEREYIDTEGDHPWDVDLEEEGVAFVVEEEDGVDEVVSSL